MPRPHVEFIQAQMLGWSGAADVAPAIGILQKVLSVDPASGARSAIVRYPAGLIVESPYSLPCDEEFLVLDGALEINGVDYRVRDYAYLPAEHQRETVTSEQGCDVLTFFEAPADNNESTNQGALIERLRSEEIEWGAASDPKVASSRVERLLLRPDTDIGERTWLLRIRVGDTPYPLNGVERHPCVEEMFLLEGDIAMSTGVLRTGAYFWRPPDIPHGPMGTSNGFLALFRAKEGAFTTEWSEPAVDIPWKADYEPVIPESLRGRLAREYDRASNY